MSLTGMDVEAVRGLALRMSHSGDELEAVRVAVRSALFSVPWQGHDAEACRAAWEEQHGPLLVAAAAALHEVSQRLQSEAEQQVGASAVVGGAGGSAGASGSQGGPAGRSGAGEHLDTLRKAIGVVVAGGQGAVADVVRRYAKDLRHGQQLLGTYWHMAQEHAERLNRYLAAGDAVKWGRLIGKVAPGLDGLGAAIDAHGQWEEDADKGFSDSEQGARALGAGAASFGVNAGLTSGGMYAGAALGTLVMPGVGTVVGGAVGAVVAQGGLWAADELTDEGVTDWITDRGADLGSGIHDAGELALDYGHEVLRSGGDLLGDVRAGARGAMDWVTPW